VAFFGNFGLEIQIGNQQVLGKTWVKKIVINKFSLGEKESLFLFMLRGSKMNI
jgi:hypothetical protein